MQGDQVDARIPGIPVDHGRVAEIFAPLEVRSEELFL
jgi:hypothetical protein